ncbi:enoyl-CoA hydratase [Pseudoteredinibacter isoporae]|uniref:Enoyl-CoA hydratase/carnithine racemase n=1 Tax=Pseudoteredinibacter isoporae TaxID=570281 RepID=A0A7X0JVE1_9GAMM|nr:enoyl-CoA hydratase [Pseudoteredinibacter isoporae]MBB6522443.1 enoyl-CoA hydratase/carnithine racemase [Pseudoteredinibacter isoporae]NHO87973.1 enoyl-CoA hydratase [Pseudoteredinibacter isoporae]NIB23696.1 enoyl-CoA hydratase [Pseudoteredinibacter isoporae]
MTDDIQIKLEGRSLHIVMDRPKRKNALTMAMYTAMADAISDAAENDEIRNIVLRGEADCFTSGNDLEDFMKNPPQGNDSPVATFMRNLYNFPKPVLAAVDGDAVGIGTTMLLHCDLVYVADSARLQMPFVKLGLVPEYASSYILPRICGHVKASELLLFGEPFDAQTAKECGLVNEVVSSDQLLSLVREKAEKLAKQPPAAVRGTKQLLRGPRRQEGADVMDEEMVLFGKGLQGKEFMEAVTAFFEKREPDFSSFN